MACAACFSLPACAAGHIEPLSQPVKSVTIGLSDAQVDLRAMAEKARRTPWTAVTGNAPAFSASTVLTVLLDGLGALVDDEDGSVETAPPARTVLSANAQSYLSSLSDRSEASLRMASLQDDVSERIRITRSFMGAASTVLAGHRLEAGAGGAPVDREAAGRDASDREADDRDVIAATIEALKEQHAVFAEVSGALFANGASGTLVFRALGVWHQDLAALERLQRSLSDSAA
ncbi:MAG: hypothetical protein ACFB6R_09165 [Alphaproteobacteria bacterium]